LQLPLWQPQCAQALLPSEHCSQKSGRMPLQSLAEEQLWTDDAPPPFGQVAISQAPLWQFQWAHSD
jgi:hypothetical protein